MLYFYKKQTLTLFLGRFIHMRLTNCLKLFQI